MELLTCERRGSPSRGVVTCPRLSLACPQTSPLFNRASSRSGATTMFQEFPSSPADTGTDVSDSADDELDPRFVFDFVTYDEIGDGQRLSLIHI